MSQRISIPALAAAALLVSVLASCDKIAPPGMARPETTAPEPTPATAPPTSAPATPVPAATRPASQPASQPAGDRVAEFLGLRGPKPAHWRSLGSSGAMRAAQYAVERDGATVAEIVVFYFGANMGGSNQANIDRWVGQFAATEGGVEPLITTRTVDGMNVTVVELAGAYQGMGQPAPTPDTLFIAAIVEAPIGNAYIRITGPKAHVESERAAFMTLIDGLRRSADAP